MKSSSSLLLARQKGRVCICVGMGHRCCSKQKVKRGLWSPEEDDKLIKHITTHGHGSWSSVPKLAGLQRCGKSCRLRWINYLRPDLKRGSFTAEEEQIIIDVHRILGNRWAQIAKHLPGRTDNEVKNFWNSCIKKKLLSQGLDPKTHNLLSSRQRASSHKLASQPQQEQSFTVSNLNGSQMRDHRDKDREIKDATSKTMVTLNPTAVTLPPHNQSMAMEIPNFELRQSPNFVGTGYGQNVNGSTTINFPYGSISMESEITSSSANIHLSGFNNLLDDNPCIWDDANAMIETFEEPRVAQGVKEPHQQQLMQENSNMEKICEMAIDKIDEASFESCSLDLGLLESTFMSGEMCRMDDFTWSF